jgi:hypothetical protein
MERGILFYIDLYFFICLNGGFLRNLGLIHIFWYNIGYNIFVNFHIIDIIHER